MSHQPGRVYAMSSAGDPQAVAAVNDAVSFIHLFTGDCGKCCTAETDGDLCEPCQGVQERIAEVILWTRLWERRQGKGTRRKPRA